MPTAFDLEKALAAWRRPFEHRRAFSVEDIEELESSLRDRVQALVDKGLTEQDAFEAAVARMGSYRAAEVEYGKVYWGKVRRRRKLLDELSWRLSMLENYLAIAVRNLVRQKGYSAINVAGLALGLACCLLIFQYVAFEWSFDAFHEKSDRIYRVAVSEQRENPRTTALLGYGAGPGLAQEVPEIVRFARLRPDIFQDGPYISYRGSGEVRTFRESRAFFADSSFLSLFTFPLVKGNPATALREPRTILLTESAARRYFGDEDPIGKTVEYTSPYPGYAGSGTRTVAGVLKDPPANSHLQFDVVMPMQDILVLINGGGTVPWLADNSDLITYVELHPTSSPEDLERKLTEALYRHAGDDLRARSATATVELQPLRRVHLDRATLGGRIKTGDSRKIYYFTLISLITLAIALINYVNLATARAMDRAKEVGIRKVVGARRGQLTAQFVVEAALMNLAALLMAVVLAASVTPLVNRLAGTQLSLATLGSALFLFFGLFAAGVLLSGLYPAFVLSSYNPVGMLRGKLATSRAGFRKGLVVLQFSASIVLLIGTGAIFAQLDFMRRMDVGLDLEHVLVVTSPRILPENVPGAAAEHSFRDEVSKLPAVKGGSFAGNIAGHGFLVSAPARLASADPSAIAELGVTGIDHHFSEVYGIDLLAGRPFEEGMPNWFFGSPDFPRPVLINEAAVRQLGLPGNEAAIDQIIVMDQIRYVVQGVLKDFNWSSAHRPVEPVLFRYNASNRYLSLRVSSADLPGTMASIRMTYEAMFPGNPFEYTFADAAFAEQYRKDEQFATLFGALAGLAILIACLGLFGLASFTALQRRKEIGVRKVLGASVRSIVSLLSRDFMLLIGAALLVATPVAYFVLDRWLENFAYHIALGPGLFLLGGLVAFAIGLATVSHQAIRAALTDPVKSLRYE